MKIATRVAYGNLLETELYKNSNIVVLDADLGNATKSISLKKLYQIDILIWAFLSKI